MDILPNLFSSNTTYHQKIIDNALDNPSLKSLQALTILALSYMSTGNINRLSGLLAILSTLSTSIALQPIDTETTSRNNLTLEERRRCFWAIYTLDKFHSTATGTSPHFSEQDILRTKLPCLEKEFQMSIVSHAKSFWDTATRGEGDIWAYCVESVGILGRVLEFLRMKNSSEWENEGMVLGKWINEWWSGLPERITTPENIGKEEVGSLILLHCTYNTYLLPGNWLTSSAVILLYEVLAFSSLACDGRMGTPTPTNGEALRRALSAAKRIAQIFETPSHLIPHTNPLVPSCLFITLRFLLIAKRDSSNEDISILKRALSQLSVHFPAAGTLSLSFK